MFGIINYKRSECVAPDFSAPVVIEGLEIINTVCPVNPLTNKRQSVVEALQSVVSDPKKSYLVDQLLQDLPVIRSDPRMNDLDRIALCTERLSSGTPAEDELIASRLSDVSSILFAKAPQAVHEQVVAAEKQSAPAPAADLAATTE